MSVIEEPNSVYLSIQGHPHLTLILNKYFELVWSKDKQTAYEPIVSSVKVATNTHSRL